MSDRVEWFQIVSVPFRNCLTILQTLCDKVNDLRAQCSENASHVLDRQGAPTIFAEQQHQQWCYSVVSLLLAGGLLL
jgi:hypothetical protein